MPNTVFHPIDDEDRQTLKTIRRHISNRTLLLRDTTPALELLDRLIDRPAAADVDALANASAQPI